MYQYARMCAATDRVAHLDPPRGRYRELPMVSPATTTARHQQAQFIVTMDLEEIRTHLQIPPPDHEEIDDAPDPALGD
jgi:hypothetical protein